MTLLETTYKSLHDCDLTKSTRDFSTKYLNRNANWYSYQTHKKRDFSLTTAIEFIKSINITLEKYKFDSEKCVILKSLHKDVLNFIYTKHLVNVTCN